MWTYFFALPGSLRAPRKPRITRTAGSQGGSGGPGDLGDHSIPSRPFLTWIRNSFQSRISAESISNQSESAPVSSESVPNRSRSHTTVMNLRAAEWDIASSSWQITKPRRSQGSRGNAGSDGPPGPPGGRVGRLSSFVLLCCIFILHVGFFCFVRFLVCICIRTSFTTPLFPCTRSVAGSSGGPVLFLSFPWFWYFLLVLCSFNVIVN